MNIPLLPHQKEFIRTKATYPALCGGYGSGKTKAATMRLIAVMAEDPGTNTLLGMPTYDLLRLRAMPGVEEDLTQIGIKYRTNKSEYSVTIPSLGTIYFRSYDRPERWVAFQAGHTILDELDTLPKEKASAVWRKAVERTRQKTRVRQNTIGNVTTPDQGVNGFTYEKWAKSTQPGYEIIKASTYDNFYLPESYAEQILSNYDPVMADAYLRGEFVSFSRNKVYHFFNRLKHHTSRTIKPDDRLYIGVDFNIGGTCSVVFVIENNKPYAVDEFVSHDTQDFTNNLVSRYKGHRVTVYPDASGKAQRTNASQSDIEIIRQAGFHVDAPNANPAVRDRVNAVNGLLAHDRLKVNTDKCQGFTAALETQGYTDKGEPEKSTFHPADDDYNDAGGYFIHRKYPINKPIIFTGISSAM